MTPSMSHRLRLVAQITRGLFLTDNKRSAMGRVFQLLSRFTWELPQTLVGWLYSLMRALVGKADRVDVLGGITFVTKKDYKYSVGVSLGTFVDLWAGSWMRGEGEQYILGNQICMHEFGHTVDSQRFGLAYLMFIGLPSLMNTLGKGDHDVFWTETRANRHAKQYFAKHYSMGWNEKGYPTENYA